MQILFRIYHCELIGDIEDEIIVNGTKDLRCPLNPLPKGHGDLKDAERLKELFRRNTGYDYHDLIDIAPTIIKADTEKSDDTKAQPMNRSEAYKIVFDDLTKCNMFKGIYDAINGKPSFMHGISTVMECIASNVSEDCYEQFTEEFASNMIASKAKANQNESR